MRRGRAGRAGGFVGEEGGGITLMMLALFLGLVLVGGAGLDVLRHEALRSDLQNRLDRAVLAALSPRATLPPEAAVRAHLGADALRSGKVALEIEVLTDVDTRPRLAVTARHAVDTVFLAMVGVPALPVVAQSAGALPPRRVEVALAIDISSSMRLGGRYEALREGLHDFVREGLHGPLRETSRIALVPFAGRVNPGRWMFQAMGAQRRHDRSSCPDFEPGDFAGTLIPRHPRLGHAPHESHWPSAGPWMGEGWCPFDPSMGYVLVASGALTTWADGRRRGPLEQTIVNGTAITWPENDPAVLARRIDGLSLFHGSAAHYGLKWALALLDPANAPMIEGARRAEREGFLAPAEPPTGAVSDGAATWDDPTAAKAIVLITDSAVTERRAPDFRAGPVRGRGGLGARAEPGSALGDRGRAHLIGLCATAAQRGVALHVVLLETDREAEETYAACHDAALRASLPGAPLPRLHPASVATLGDALFDVRRRLWGAGLASRSNG